MHYHWQVLAKGTDESEAIANAENVLNNEVGSGVFDWYDIGGRWGSKDTKGKTIKNAVNAKVDSIEFWARLKEAEKNQANAFKEAVKGMKRALKVAKVTLEEYLKKPVADNSLVGHYLVKIGNIKAGYYCEESYLATDGEVWGSPLVPKDVKENIKKNPDEYWLVSMDIHN